MFCKFCIPGSGLWFIENRIEPECFRATIFLVNHDVFKTGLQFGFTRRQRKNLQLRLLNVRFQLTWVVMSYQFNEQSQSVDPNK